MTKLTTKEVYVPAYPSLENGGTPAKAEGMSYITGKPLERKEKYVFSKEELEKLLGEVWKDGFYCDEMLPEDQMPKFIQSLF